jgi:hypothetical protein
MAIALSSWALSYVTPIGWTSDNCNINCRCIYSTFIWNKEIVNAFKDLDPKGQGDRRTYGAGLPAMSIAVQYHLMH